MNGLFKVIFGIGLSMQVMVGQAALKVSDSAKYDRAWSQGKLGYDKKDLVEAICNGCNVRIAMKQIIPSSFNVYVDGGAEKISNIKYKIMNKRWGPSLLEIAEKNNLHVEFLRHNNSVMIKKAAKNRGRVVVTNFQGSSHSMMASKRYELIKGEKLKTALQRWAGQEGWTLLFELTTNVHIDNNAVFYGNLIDSVKQVLEAYQSRGVFQQVQFEYSRANKTIVLTARGEK